MKKEKERIIGVREKLSISCLSYALWLETKPGTQVYALTGNQTHDISVSGMMLQPSEPHLPGPENKFLINFIEINLNTIKFTNLVYNFLNIDKCFHHVTTTTIMIFFFFLSLVSFCSQAYHWKSITTIFWKMLTDFLSLVLSLIEL